MNLLRSIFLLLFFFVGISSVSAASLYMDPTSGTYAEGASFSIKIRIDNQDECINAASVVLNYPEMSIKAIDFVRGESIFSLWTTDPTIDHENGTVSFSGGLPGGYCGRVQGDPGLTNVLLEVIFQVPGLIIGEKGSKTGTITFDEETEVLLNDGRGTKAELILGTSRFSIVPPGEVTTDFDWFASIRNDTIKPEPFSIDLQRDESVWNGEWFVIFNTLDKQTGIDHFEVYETDVENEGFVRGKGGKPSLWKVAKSPYLLEDQSLYSVIRVRAFDKAGNDRLAGYIPDESLRTTIKKSISKSMFMLAFGIIVLIVLLGVVSHMYKKMKKKKDNTDDIIAENRAENELENVYEEKLLNEEQQSKGNEQNKDS